MAILIKCSHLDHPWQMGTFSCIYDLWKRQFHNFPKELVYVDTFIKKKNPLKKESTMYVIYINTSLGRKPGQESEQTSQQMGGSGVNQDRQVWAAAPVASSESITSTGRTQSSPGHCVAWPLSYFQRLFYAYPRTSNELISNYISTEMYNVIRSFIYLFFHFASSLTDDYSHPSIRSEDWGLMTWCII